MALRIKRKVSDSNPIKRSVGLGIQPRYEAPHDLRVKYRLNAITSGV